MEWVMRCSGVLVGLVGGVLLVVGGLVFAGAGEQVDVRVLDLESGKVLAKDRVRAGARLAIAREGEDRRYLGLRVERFRGREALAVSLAQSPEDWQHRSYTTWHQPSELDVGGHVQLELIPVGWAKRFCRARAAVDEPAVRDFSLGLTVGSEMMATEPGWNGRDEVAMIDIAEPDRTSDWRAGVDKDDTLYLMAPDRENPLLIDTVRKDFPMSRTMDIGDETLDLFYTPSGYSTVFCQRYKSQGADYAAGVADYFFGSGEHQNEVSR